MSSKNLRAVSLFTVFSLAGLAFALSAAMEYGFPKRRPVAGVKAADPLRHQLRINGDRDQDEVIFPHHAHQERLHGEQGCPTCHHVSKPNDFSSPCFLCHTDMEQETRVFNHAKHQEKLGGKLSCRECHDPALTASWENSKPCRECHRENMGMEPDDRGQRFSMFAPGYEDAMHGLCVNCHEDQARQLNRPELPECDTCHRKVHHEPSEARR